MTRVEKLHVLDTGAVQVERSKLPGVPFPCWSKVRDCLKGMG